MYDIHPPFRAFRDLLIKCASTSMSSKLIHSEKPFFANMVVNAVMSLDQEELDESLIGVNESLAAECKIRS